MAVYDPQRPLLRVDPLEYEELEYEELEELVHTPGFDRLKKAAQTRVDETKNDITRRVDTWQSGFNAGVVTALELFLNWPERRFGELKDQMKAQKRREGTSE